MLKSQTLDEMSCMVGKMRDALRQVGNGKFLGWADHSGSKWITVDQSGGEAPHGSQITNFRLRRGLPSEMGAGRWVGGMAHRTPPVWVGGGWMGYPSNQSVLPHLSSFVDIVIG